MGEIKWSSVESSNIAMIGYDDETEELHVKFNSGAEYVYNDVPEEVFEEFLSADSKGQYLNEHIKGKYQYRKVG